VPTYVSHIFEHSWNCCQALWEWEFQLPSQAQTLWVLLCRSAHSSEVCQISSNL